MPATVSFVDIAGIVRGASEGQGLGNKFLANIREADAICQVIRVFSDPDVVHVEGRVSPKDDIETINTELILADLQTLEKAVPRLEKEARHAKDRAPLLAAAQEAQRVLDDGPHGLRGRARPRRLRELSLLTAKPFLYVFNLDEEELGNAGLRAELLGAGRAGRGGLPRRQDRGGARRARARTRRSSCSQSTGQEEPGLDQLARVGFAALGLQTYLTAGPKEARAWTIAVGATAPEAAGVIHTDFQQGFIKAEVISFDDLVDAGSVAAARAAGKARMEGKDYVMQDGDVVEFRFNV